MTLPHAILPLPLKTGMRCVIYKCNKYPKEYIMNYKDYLLFLLLGVVTCLLVTYLLRDVFYDYHIDSEDLNFLQENWTDTTKRPYNIHGLDSEEE